VRVVVTGTPGTGKTTATELLADDPGLDATVVHLNDAVRDETLWTERDAERDSLVADVDAIREWLAGRDDLPWTATGSDEGDEGDEAVDTVDAGGDGGEDAPGPVVVDSHLAHHLDADRVVVLRCAPAALEERLTGRGESERKARENAESEALDVILSEAFERHGPERVYEIDTTDRSPEEVAADVAAAIRGEREPSAGTVDFVDYLDGSGSGGDLPGLGGMDGMDESGAVDPADWEPSDRADRTGPPDPTDSTGPDDPDDPGGSTDR
jgi:adenylate kinase